MRLCRIAMVVLACLVWGLSTPSMACEHGVGAYSEAAHAGGSELIAYTAHMASLAAAISVAHAAPRLPMNKCPGACHGARCCHGGLTSCSTGQAPAHMISGFELLLRASGARTGRKPEQAVTYKEPLYGLDRPPKA
jgi:hypothetical protein